MLSRYERRRLANMERNQAALRRLGLADVRLLPPPTNTPQHLDKSSCAFAGKRNTFC